MNGIRRAPRNDVAAVSAWTMEQIACCPICGGQSLQQHFRVTQLTDGPLFAWAREGPYTSSVIVGCRDCSFLFKSPRPSWEILEACYARSDEAYLGNLAEDDPAFRTDFR